MVDYVLPGARKRGIGREGAKRRFAVARNNVGMEIFPVSPRNERRYKCVKKLLIERFIEIVPLRIARLNQLKFPRAAPFLDLPLARERRVPRVMRFIPDETVNAVVGCKSLDDLFFVLPHAFAKIIRRAGVERAVPLARKNVDVEGLHGFLSYLSAHPGANRDPVKT